MMKAITAKAIPSWMRTMVGRTGRVVDMVQMELIIALRMGVPRPKQLR